MTKQTAANNKFLAEVKRDWNNKIYRRVLECLNDGGTTDAKNCLQRYTTRKIEGATVEPSK